MEIKLRGTPPNGDTFLGTCPICGSVLKASRAELKIVLGARPVHPGVRTVDATGREVFERFEVGRATCPVCGLHAVDFEPVKVTEG